MKFYHLLLLKNNDNKNGKFKGGILLFSICLVSFALALIIDLLIIVLPDYLHGISISDRSMLLGKITNAFIIFATICMISGMFLYVSEVHNVI